jgi:pilus assembly protein CpaC
MNESLGLRVRGVVLYTNYLRLPKAAVVFLVSLVCLTAVAQQPSSPVLGQGQGIGSVGGKEAQVVKGQEIASPAPGQKDISKQPEPPSQSGASSNVPTLGVETVPGKPISPSSITAQNLRQPVRNSVRDTKRRADQSEVRTFTSVTLYQGEVKVLDRPGVSRVAIGNGKLITAQVVEDKQIVLLGESAGTTTLYVWLRNGAQVNYEVTVTADHSGKITGELRNLLSAYPEVSVNRIGDRIILDGAYANQESAEKIKKIVAAYPQILNLIKDRPAEQKVEVERMVQLDVKVVEIRKNALESLGIKWFDQVTGPVFATSSMFYSNTGFRGVPDERYQPALWPTATAARPFITYLGFATQISSLLNFLEQNGDSWVMAEPKVTSVSGGEATFQVGGEIPIPVAAGPGQIQVVYKEYGVIIKFNPVIDQSGNVRTGITAEVSQPNLANSRQGFLAFDTNRTKTDVSMREGETLVIAGLLKNQGSKGSDAVPVLGSIPVIGRLFSTKEFRNERIEMVMVVTPRILNPDSDLNRQLTQDAKSKLESISDLVKQQLAK